MDENNAANVQPTQPVQSEISKDARMWGMLCHLIALSGLIVAGIGFFLGPLVVWLIKREDDPFIDDQGKESVNFQLTMLLASIVAGLLTLVVIGFVLLPIIGILDIVFVIIATIKANEGTRYRYPVTIRFIK